MGISEIVSKEWSDVVELEEKKEPLLGSSNLGHRLYESPNLIGSFSTTCRMMIKEEWRQTVDFARKRNVLLFPALVSLFSMILAMGFPFLVGEGVPDTINAVEDGRAFSWDQMKIAMHFPLFVFSLGMGSFAFLGKIITSQRSSGLNYLLASPSLQPLKQSTNYFAYYVKEVTFYILLVLIPVIFGISLGITFSPFAGLNNPLEYTSLLTIFIGMILTLSQGLAISFFGSALWTRGGINSKLVPIVAIISILIFALDIIPLEYFIIGLSWHLNHSIILIPIGLSISFAFAISGAYLVGNSFEQISIEKQTLFNPIYERLGFIRNTKMRLLVSKELLELIRSGAVKKMAVSYSVPLAVLLLLAWLVDFTEYPIPVNLLTYAPFLGFFGFNYYSWITAIDSNAHYNALPTTVPEVIRAKVMVYFLVTTWISLLFLILMAWNLGAWWSLPAALIVMLANSVYIVALTAFLMGLRPNKAIFDASIMFWFWIATVIPLLLLFLLSFTQGDIAIMQNWGQAIVTEGLDANRTAVSSEELASVQTGFGGIATISAILFALGWGLLRLLEKKWGKATFDT